MRVLENSGPKTEMKGTPADLPVLGYGRVQVTHDGPSQCHPLKMARLQSNNLSYTGSIGIEILWQPCLPGWSGVLCPEVSR